MRYDVNRHSVAELRRDLICHAMHEYDDSKMVLYSYLSKVFKVSASTIRQIHTGHCRKLPWRNR